MNVYGLVGFPLEHSFSRKYFLEKFRTENIQDATFELFPLASVSEFKDLITTYPQIKGLAVTIPYKVSIIPSLSQLTNEASAIGAVNCIQVLPDKLIGHNTDAIGFEKSLLPLLTKELQGALVLGNGGAAQAVKFVLQKLSIPYCIVTRIPRQNPNAFHYEDITADVINRYPLVINCTPVGTSPDVSEKPAIPYHLLGPKNLLYDLIYNPAETSFLREGKHKGSRIKNGLEMLILQAEENWKIWTNPY